MRLFSELIYNVLKSYVIANDPLGGRDIYTADQKLCRAIYNVSGCPNHVESGFSVELTHSD